MICTTASGNKLPEAHVCGSKPKMAADNFIVGFCAIEHQKSKFYDFRYRRYMIWASNLLTDCNVHVQIYVTYLVVV